MVGKASLTSMKPFIRRASNLLMIVAATFASSPGDAAGSADCRDLFEHHVKSDMDLDYQSFDQTPGQGFRALASAGCPAEAANLIEAYINVNDATETSLIWHVAQLRGRAGQVEEAIRAATASLDPDEPADSAFKWNAHVNAYIAFLIKDRESFEANRGALQQAADLHRGNRINAGMWTRLAPYIELGYSEAVLRAYDESAD